MQVVIAKPEFPGKVAKAVFVFEPDSFKVGTVWREASLYHSPPTTVRRLVTKDIDDSLAIGIDIINTVKILA